MELTTLSWMLLAADRADSLQKFVTVIFFLSILSLGFRCFMMFMEKIEDYKVIPWWAIALLIGSGIPMAITSLVPNATVILQVAAIELGDDVLNSDEFQRILNAYIPKE